MKLHSIYMGFKKFAISELLGLIANLGLYLRTGNRNPLRRHLDFQGCYLSLSLSLHLSISLSLSLSFSLSLFVSVCLSLSLFVSLSLFSLPLSISLSLCLSLSLFLMLVLFSLSHSLPLFMGSAWILGSVPDVFSVVLFRLQHVACTWEDLSMASRAGRS